MASEWIPNERIKVELTCFPEKVNMKIGVLEPALQDDTKTIHETLC
jgi:hypothetical protein